MKKLLRYKYKLQINIFFQTPDFELSEMCKHIKAVDVDLQSVFLKRLFVLIFLKLCNNYLIAFKYPWIFNISVVSLFKLEGLS